MYLRYGNYTFAANSLFYTTNITATRDDNGTPTGKTEQWAVQGDIIGSSQADLAAKWNVLTNALAVHYRDLVFYRDDGGIAQALLNGASTSGVVIVNGPNFVGDPVGKGWVNGLSFSFTAEASYVLPAFTTPNALNLFDLQETVSIYGGGPLTGHLQPVNGAPIKQTIFAQTPYKASQSGSAKGPFPYPVPLPPLWPAAEIRPNRRIDLTPVRGDQGVKLFQVSWSYEYESVSPLLGYPHFLAG